MKFGWKQGGSSVVRKICLVDIYCFFIALTLLLLSFHYTKFVNANLEQKIQFVGNTGIMISGLEQDIGSLVWGSQLFYKQIQGEKIGEFGGTSFLTSLLDVSSDYITDTELKKLIDEYRNEIESLLGGDEPQSYIIVLQNTNEARPNGGFFGSYIHITIDRGFVTEYEVRDSYLPGFDRPGVGIQGPEWLLDFMPTNEIHFVGANKIGFTYADGGHIKKLYELSYPDESLRGVIFLRLDALVKILPSLETQIVEWQFMNAMSGKIPRTDRKQKSLYMDDLKQTIPSVLQEFVINPGMISMITDAIDVYLEDIPGAFHSFLKDHNLTTRFDENKLYAWDSNISFSKTDGFVDKQLQCTPLCDGLDCEDTSILAKEILSLQPSLYSGYSCKKSYDFSVPDSYFESIDALEKVYGAETTSREQHILGLTKTWGTRAVVYLGNQWVVSGLTGAIYEPIFFETPFGQGISYKIRMEGEGRREVTWTLTKKPQGRLEE